MTKCTCKVTSFAISNIQLKQKFSNSAFFNVSSRQVSKVFNRKSKAMMDISKEPATIIKHKILFCITFIRMESSFSPALWLFEASSQCINRTIHEETYNCTSEAEMMNLSLVLLIAASYYIYFPGECSGDGVVDEAEFAKEYLEKYYNLDTRRVRYSRKKTEALIKNTIQKMQRFLGLKVTGILDSDTINLMQQPRCGFPDVGEYSFFPGNPRWKKRDLTYRILNYTPDLHRSEVDLAIERAFRVWSDVIPLTFTRIYDRTSDIEISFAAGGHYDNYPFDGPGHTLAHAYAPGNNIGGDAHFDEDETWDTGITGVNLFLVAAHEFGHSLGLRHSNHPDALMYPYYKAMEPSQFTLHEDDIYGISYLYGHNYEYSNIVKGLPCPSGMTFDAVTTYDEEILFFQPKYIWIQNNQESQAQPHNIISLWPLLPNTIHAAYEYSDDENDLIVVFKGRNYYVINGGNLTEDSPKDISQLGFPNTIKKIDATVHDKTTGKTYFFVRDKYWSYDEEEQTMDVGFPKPISRGFPGIGKRIRSAFEKDGYFYFLDGKHLYEFSTENKRVTSVSKKNRWFKCLEKDNE